MRNQNLRLVVWCVYVVYDFHYIIGGESDTNLTKRIVGGGDGTMLNAF